MSRRRLCTKRPTYFFGVAWIAENDEAACMDADAVKGFVSTLLLADLFGADPYRVAVDVVRYRAGVRLRLGKDAIRHEAVHQ